MGILVKTYAVSTPKFPADRRPLSILMIADLHGAYYGRDNRDLLAVAEKMKPDLILTCGDMVRSVPDFDITELVRFYASLRELAPVYAVNGNHETRMKLHTVTFGVIYQEYVSELQRVGVTVLNNAQAKTEAGGMPIRIYGYEIPYEKYAKFRRPRLTFEDIHDELGDCAKEPYTILLAHNPVFAKIYREWGADLVLSGHYHGGLIRVGNRALLSPYGSLLPRYGYGIYRSGTKTMIVTAGAGDHSLTIRINDPREVVQIILDRGEA